jgi:hypothetical protein
VTKLPAPYAANFALLLFSIANLTSMQKIQENGIEGNDRSKILQNF